jgi:hypothetical protein
LAIIETGQWPATDCHKQSANSSQMMRLCQKNSAIYRRFLRYYYSMGLRRGKNFI